ncbi:MAG TPA: hypothetical protein PLT43_12750, partial [Mesotoga sp.]|nr:hypothetical protein [Mesotoga sp.]
MKKNIVDKIKEYHFEFRHVTVLFIILFSFQLLVSFINKSSIREFLETTQDWYQKESAEEIANLTATAFELGIESINPGERTSPERERQIIQAFDIIYSQQQLTHNVQKLVLIFQKGDSIAVLNDGSALYSALVRKVTPGSKASSDSEVEELYRTVETDLKATERIKSIIPGKETFHIFVPFVIKGEFIGAIYMLIQPDFSSISNQVISSYDETSVIYLSLITLGLLAMYFISSYTVKERDETQKLFFEEHEQNLKKQINYENE